jgi:four helix bundle protein
MRPGLDALEDRTRQFAIDTTRLCKVLAEVPALRHIAWQLARASGGVGFNHRAMRRSRSNREFLAKLQIVNEEIDECVFWLQIAEGVADTPVGQLPSVLGEATELRSIFAKARSTMRQRA